MFVLTVGKSPQVSVESLQTPFILQHITLYNILQLVYTAFVKQIKQYQMPVRFQKKPWAT